MKLPCQEVVWEILPAIRSALALELINLDVSQLDSAKLLGIAPSAVSQYRSKKRGYRVVFDDEIMVATRKLAKDMKEGRVLDPAPRICEICRMIRGGTGACSPDNDNKTCFETDGEIQNG